MVTKTLYTVTPAPIGINYNTAYIKTILIMQSFRNSFNSWNLFVFKQLKYVVSQLNFSQAYFIQKMSIIHSGGFFYY